MKLSDYQNMTLLGKYPNIMTISLSQGKTNKYNKVKNTNLSNNNISTSTFYNFKNNGNKKSSIYNNYNGINNYNNMEFGKKSKYNNKSIVTNNMYLEGYKTFFNKNKTCK